MRDEYDFTKSVKSPYVKKLQNTLENPFWDTLAKFIKKFKSSKSYWSVSFLVIVFTFREAVAWKYGSVISEYAQKQLEGSDYSWLWTAIEFIFDFGGSWELALGGFLIFIILSLVKVSEGENNTITLRDSFLSLLLLFTLICMGVYAISSNDKNHQETHKQQKITHDKLDEIKALINLQGGDEKYFLEKYFGKDYAIILNHPQTYHNFTTLLKQTNKTADELLKEREELLNKIKSQSFNPKLQSQINKAFKELRYEDAREFLDAFLEANSAKEKELIKAHYMKALSYMEQIRYREAKEEFEKIASGINNPNILFDYGYMYSILGEYDKAIEYYQKVLKITFSSLQDYSPSILKIYDYIGLALYNKGEYNKALKYYEKSLKIRLLSLRDKNIDIALNYMNIGLAWHKKGKTDKASKYYEKSLKIILLLKEKKSSDKLLKYKIWNYYVKFDKVLICYERQQKFYEAFIKTIDSSQWKIYQDEKDEKNIPLECSMENIKMRLITADENYPYVASIYEVTASNCYRQGKYNKALKYYEKSLKIELAILGKNHPYIATLHEDIGSTWDSKGKYDKALKHYEKSLKIRSYTLGENHPDTAISYYYIGFIRYRQGEYKKAIEYYEKALSILRQIFPNGHPNIDTVKENLVRAKKSLKGDNEN